MKKRSTAFKIGALLIAVNVPVGYAGVTIGLTANALTGSRACLVVGAGIYAVSWIIALAGVCMAGPAGYYYTRVLWRWLRMRRHKL